MQIEVKETDYCKLEVTYEAGMDQIDTKRNQILPFFKNAPVPGFRPGAASLEVIKIHYRNQINDALKRALAEQAYHDTLFEKNIKPFGPPEFKNMMLLAHKFSCEFSMYKKPDFELASYKELEIPKPAIEFTTTELAQKMLQEMRIRCGEAIPYADTDFVQDGDNVIIDYRAFDKNDAGEDVELVNLNATGELLTVGKSQLPGFDDNLLGMQLNEKREFNLKVPETGLPSVANKTIRFEVVLNAGSKIKPMPLNDELAKKMGKETIAELEQTVTDMATARHAASMRDAQIRQVSARLIADNDVKIPDWLVLSEAQYLATGAQLQWESLVDEDKQKYLSVAGGNVKLALILDKIRENEPETQLSDQEVLEMIKQTVAKGNPNPEQVLKSMNENGYLTVLVARIRDEQALDFVLKNAKIIE